LVLIPHRVHERMRLQLLEITLLKQVFKGCVEVVPPQFEQLCQRLLDGRIHKRAECVYSGKANGDLERDEHESGLARTRANGIKSACFPCLCARHAEHVTAATREGEGICRGSTPKCVRKVLHGLVSLMLAYAAKSPAQAADREGQLHVRQFGRPMTLIFLPPAGKTHYDSNQDFQPVLLPTGVDGGARERRATDHDEPPVVLSRKWRIVSSV